MLKRLRASIDEANSVDNPLAALDPSLLRVSLRGDDSVTTSVADGGNVAGIANDGNEQQVAMIEHFTSKTLPASLLESCLQLFEENMGKMYERSEWGLDMDEKRRELTHVDARFLVVTAPDATAVSTVPITPSSASNCRCYEDRMLLGFAHMRHEFDDDDRPTCTVTYLYELQVASSHRSLGLGKRLVSIVELLSTRMDMEKVMLTVFHYNEAAMGFYEQRGYEVDESSPSNFDDGEGCDYEILSKALDKPPLP